MRRAWGVVLRQSDASDAATFAGWELDPVFCAHNDWTFGSPQEASLAWWADALARPDPELTRLLALVGQDPVGYVDLHGAEPGFKELGYAVAPSSRWGHGLGTALAVAGLDYGFGRFGLERIWAEAAQANVASVRILERIGVRDKGEGDVVMFLGRSTTYRRFEISRGEFLG